MQKLTVIGNLIDDPKLTETSSGIACCRFSVAVNRNYFNANGERGVDYFSCTAWRGLGETIAKYCYKGDKIYLEGRLEQRSYEDNKGIKRTVYDYLIDSMELLPNKRQSESATNEESSPRAERPTKRKKPTLEEVDDDSDIPF